MWLGTVRFSSGLLSMKKAVDRSLASKISKSSYTFCQLMQSSLQQVWQTPKEGAAFLQKMQRAQSC